MKNFYFKLLNVFSLLIFIPFNVFAFGSVAHLDHIGQNQRSEQEIQIQENKPTKEVVEETLNKEVIIEMFTRDECKHCQAAKKFFKEFLSKNKDVKIVYHNLADKQEYNKWLELTTLKKISKITPIIYIPNTIIQGFDRPETTGKRIEFLVNKARKNKLSLSLDEYIKAGAVGDVEGSAEYACDEKCEVDNSGYLFSVPFFGVIDLSKYSLPVISLILGLIDGFNPCAMWVLVTFLILLMHSGSRKKMWQMAGLFILAEAVMYYLILTVWFKTWDFIGLDRIVTPIIGLLAIGGGIFFLYEWRKAGNQCQIVDPRKQANIRDKIKLLIQREFNLITAIGIIGIAFSVNIIEFACSIGVPQAYTKILEMNKLGFVGTQFNMFLYILMYMLDDLIVFGIALYGIDKLHLANKYSKWSNLVGGILMIILGLILIFARDLLVF